MSTLRNYPFVPIVVDDKPLEKKPHIETIKRFFNSNPTLITNPPFKDTLEERLEEIYRVNSYPVIGLDRLLMDLSADNYESGLSVFMSILGKFPAGGVVIPISKNYRSQYDSLKDTLSYELNSNWIISKSPQKADIQEACVSFLEGREGEYRLS
jgi:hypothetical protein